MQKSFPFPSALIVRRAVPDFLACFRLPEYLCVARAPDVEAAVGDPDVQPTPAKFPVRELPKCKTGKLYGGAQKSTPDPRSDR